MVERRVYVVRWIEDGLDKEALIEASHRNHVLRYLGEKRFAIKPARGKEVADLMRAGIKVEVA